MQRRNLCETRNDFLAIVEDPAALESHSTPWSFKNSQRKPDSARLAFSEQKSDDFLLLDSYVVAYNACCT